MCVCVCVLVGLGWTSAFDPGQLGSFNLRLCPRLGRPWWQHANSSEEGAAAARRAVEEQEEQEQEGQEVSRDSRVSSSSSSSSSSSCSRMQWGRASQLPGFETARALAFLPAFFACFLAPLADGGLLPPAPAVAVAVPAAAAAAFFAVFADFFDRAPPPVFPALRLSFTWIAQRRKYF